jgi:exopolysaccharide production protein ExoZ
MNSKLHTIQYLRGLAAILVLASHALLYPVVEQVMVLSRLGWLGVILFFVVSGFIMVIVTGEGQFDPARFLRRRVLRVVPLYWGVTILAAIMTLTLPGLFKSMVFDGEQLAMSMFFVPFYNPATHGLHPFYKLGWTLNYEMFFYLSFALLALLRVRQRVLVLTLAYLGLATVGIMAHPLDPIPAFYTSFMPMAFVAGAWLGVAHVEGRLRRIERALAIPLLVIGLAGLVEGFAIDRGVVEDETAFLGFLAFAVAAVSLVVGFEHRLPRVEILDRLGDASYSIYLAHMFSVAGIAGVLLRTLRTDDPVIIGTAMLFAIVGGVAIGWMVYRLIEQPLMARMRRLA